jgi:hypothetical protein
MSRELWFEVCEILKWHNKGSDNCIQTLNRLWRKHVEVRAPDGSILLDVPILTEEGLTVSIEHWSLDNLLQLRRAHPRNRPLAFPPVVVLRWFDRDFLIDGTTRVNFWAAQGNVGPHAVLVIGAES